MGETHVIIPGDATFASTHPVALRHRANQAGEWDHNVDVVVTHVESGDEARASVGVDVGAGGVRGRGA
jgi:hypothetical protein